MFFSCKEFYGGDDDSDFDVEEYKLRNSRTPDEYEIPETCMACDKVLDNHEQLLEHVELKPDCKEIYENHKAIQYEEYVDQTCEICRTTLPSLLQLVNHFKDNPDCEREYGSKEVQKISEKIRLQWMEREEEERKEKETVKSRRKSNNKRSKKLNQKNKSKVKLKNRTSVDLSDQGDDGESKRARDEQWEPQGVLNVDDLESVDPEICVHPELPIAGGSKIDHEDDTVEDLLVLPEGTSLTGQYASPKEINAAEFFVGMGLSNDGESIEVRYLLHRQNITLDGLQLLFHAVMSVTECDAKTLMNDRSSPLTLVPHYDVLKYRDKFSKDLIAAGNVMPSPGKVICQALPSQETHFIAEDMVEIPNTQLIYNESLHPVDIGAVGIQSSSGEDSNKVYKVSPLFTVNMEDWRKTIKSFYQILFNWFGGRDKLQEILLNTPCGKTALDAWLTDIREECHQNNMEPKITEICEHCGQCLEYNKFITSEVRAYRMHLKSHDLTCKTCGEESSSVTAKKYHQRTHLKHFVRCDKCNYVGTTESSLATHIKFTHTKAVCQICGNEFTCHNGLTSHMQHVHNPEENNKKWYETEPSQCDICNKWFSNHKIMRRHRKNHDEAKPEPAARSSTGAKEDPNDFKFMCPIHDTCKKYFKSRKHLRSHLKKFKERDILDNSSNGMAEGALIGVLPASSGDFVKPQLSGHKEDVRLPPESTPQQQPQPDDLFGLLKKKSNQTPIDPDAEERRRRKKLTKKRPHPQQQALHHSQQLQQLNLQQQQQHPHLPTGSSDYHTPITPFVPNSDNCAFGNSSVNPYQPHPGSQALAQSVPPHHLQANPYRNPYVGHFPDPNSFKFFNHAYVPGGMHTPLTSEIHVRDMSMAKEEVLSD